LIIFAGAAAGWFAKCAWFNRNVLVVAHPMIATLKYDGRMMRVICTIDVA